ncbi:MAG TPA: HDOD domain-containing protein [Steroidobacteraceae bacterium]|nr:HDOD domain-containing protein [Steroidobacteraceae bacterium]
MSNTQPPLGAPPSRASLLVTAPVESTRPKDAAFLDRLAEDLGAGPLNLPCFPDVVPRVRQAIADPDSTSDDIVRIAGTEPRLAARLLQTANSVVFNPSGVPFSELRSAVTRLGQHLVQSVTMAFALQQLRAEPSLRPVAKQLNALWEKSIAVASICQVLANRLRVPSDKVFLTGLLHGIGYFYVMVKAGERANEVELDQRFAHLAAARHPAFGRAIMEKWGFERVMCEAVGNQLQYERKPRRAADITDVVIAGVVLAESFLEGNGDLARCAGVNSFVSLGLSDDELAAILKHTEHSLSALREALGR